MNSKQTVRIATFGMAMFCFMLCMIACSKKNETLSNTNSITFIGQKNSLNLFAMTTDKVKFQNNLLILDDYQTYYDIVNSLMLLKEDSSYYSSVLNALGFNPMSDTVQENEPYDPILYYFEQRFNGFTSLRSVVENSERAFLELGGEPEDYEDFWMQDHILQALLNKNKEICIGNHIIRIIDEEHVILITGKFWELLNEIRSQSLQDVIANPREHVIVLNPKSQEDRNIFKSIQNESCFPRFVFDYNYNNETIILRSTSVGIVVNPWGMNYQWYIDGRLVHSGVGANGATSPALPLAQGTNPYNIELRIFDVNGCDKSSSSNHVFSGCPTAYFSVTDDLTDVFTLHFAVVTPTPGLIYNWDIFDELDNFVGSGTGTTLDFTFPNTQYLMAYYDVTLRVSQVGTSCDEAYESRVMVECGLKNRNRPPYVMDYASSNRRIKGYFVLDNFLWSHTICARTKHYRKKNNGNWVLDKANLLTVGFYDGLYRIRDTNDRKNCLNTTHLNNITSWANQKCVERTVSSNKTIFLRNADMISGHKAQDSGNSCPWLNISFN